MANELIKTSTVFEEQVDEIVIGPPPANIVSAALMKELAAQIEESNADPHKKLIVIKGDGKHFSFGASVEEHTADKVADMLPTFHGMIWRVLSSQVPTVASVTGLCLGGGFELALACSMIFCDRSAAFAVPEIQLGVFPPPATHCGNSPLRTTPSRRAIAGPRSCRTAGWPSSLSSRPPSDWMRAGPLSCR